MDSKTLREKFLKFFEGKDHKIVPSSSLVPKGDTSVLLTTAGMQQFKPYFAGTKNVVEDFGNKNLVSVQKCFRTSDIESVGDESHLTFFEMLGNFSIGGYGKKEAIQYAWELMTSKDWYGLPKDKFFATVFAGDEQIPADEESEKFWKEVAPNIEVKKLGREDNFWPNPVWVGTCGPSSELHYILDDGSSIEVWNLVFTQYLHNEDGSFKDLGSINIDTGMGLERLAMIYQNKSSVFETDLYQPIIRRIEELTGKKYEDDAQSTRIITDHIKAAVFLIRDGVIPGNKLQDYILRRLLRRAALKAYLMNKEFGRKPFKSLVESVMDIYSEYFDAESIEDIEREVSVEIGKFRKTLEQGLKEVEKIDQIDGKKAFDLYQTFGFPYEVTEELFRQKRQEIDREQFKTEFEKHRELSRTASAGMFKGGLADAGEVTIKYHTATHLLHQALRDVLGPEVFQKGSNITSERLRFDFSYDRKLTEEEVKQVEDLVNQRIKEDLPVDHKIVSLDEAKSMNAIGLFNEKYADKVSIYGVGPGYKLDPESKDQRDRGGYYSLEFCGGPHVEQTGMIGGIKISKEEAISAGVRRIRATLV